MSELVIEEFVQYILPVLFYFLSMQNLFAQEIKIYTWNAFLSNNVVDSFTKETGHTVKQYYYDNEVYRNALLLNGKAAKYDLVLVDGTNTKKYGELGFLQSFADTKLNNLQHIGEKWQKSCGRFGVAYAKGTLGIIYRRSLSQQKIHSWQDLLTPPKEHRKTTMMLKDDIDTIAIALLAQKNDPFTSDIKQLKSAYEALNHQSEHLLQYGYPLSYTLEQGKLSQLTLAPLYAGDLHNIKETTGQDDWQYIVPEEGTIFFVDCFTAPTGKQISTATKAFLEYINRPDIAYQNAHDIWFSTTNKSALLLADDKYKHDPELNPEPAVLQKSYDYQSLSKESMVIRNRIISLLNIGE